MKKNLTTLLLFLALTSGARAALIRVQSPDAADFSAFTSEGVSLTLFPEASFLFEVGIFVEGFDFDATPLDEWREGFVTQLNDPIAWGDLGSPVAGRLNGQSAMKDAEAVGLQGYIFGHNADFSEIIVLTNPSWIFPEYNPLDLSASAQNTWNIASAGTVVVSASLSTGTASGAGFLDIIIPGVSGSMRLISTSAIPEPSAACLAAFGLCGAFFRRRGRIAPPALLSACLSGKECGENELE